MTPGQMLGSKLTPGTLLRDYFKEPLVRLIIRYPHKSHSTLIKLWIIDHVWPRAIWKWIRLLKFTRTCSNFLCQIEKVPTWPTTWILRVSREFISQNLRELSATFLRVVLILTTPRSQKHSHMAKLEFYLQFPPVLPHGFFSHLQRSNSVFSETCAQKMIFFN